MPNVYEYFHNDDVSFCLPIESKFELTLKNSKLGLIKNLNLEIIHKIVISSDFAAYVSTFYIPKTDNTKLACKAIIENLETLKKQAEAVEILSSKPGDVHVGKHKYIFSNRIFFYSETQLEKVELKELEALCIERGICATFRSQIYLCKRMEAQKPLAFISHDSRNKELIARPLANGLKSRFCYVWYDEYSLKIGDDLRESIETGIKEAKKCILILTPEFLNNPGWGKTEFNSIFTKEIVLNERIVLPIWFNVKKEDIYNYSPSLLNRFALEWPNQNKMSEEEYKIETEILISNVHSALTRD